MKDVREMLYAVKHAYHPDSKNVFPEEDEDTDDDNDLSVSGIIGSIQ